VLLTDESNFFAAMIIGVVLAESNELAKAKEIFTTVLENCQHNKKILLNMANLEILNKRYDQAIATFTLHLSKSSA